MTRTKKKDTASEGKQTQPGSRKSRFHVLIREMQGDLEHIGYAVNLTFLNDTQTVADLTAADAEGNTVNITGLTPLSIEDAHSNIGRYRKSFENIRQHGVLEAWQRIKSLPDAERQTLGQGFAQMAEKFDAEGQIEPALRLRSLADAIGHLGGEHSL